MSSSLVSPPPRVILHDFVPGDVVVVGRSSMGSTISLWTDKHDGPEIRRLALGEIFIVIEHDGAKVRDSWQLVIGLDSVGYISNDAPARELL